MNFMEGQLASEGGTVYFQSGGVKLRIPADKAAQLKDYPEKRITFGVRPEDLPEAACAAPGETFDVTVEVMEPLGSEVYLNVKAGDRSLITRAGPKTTAKPHANLCLKPALENIHFFDIRDEKTLV
jgi:multiple sugar transport system ATP-binding protein